VLLNFGEGIVFATILNLGGCFESVFRAYFLGIQVKFDLIRANFNKQSGLFEPSNDFPNTLLGGVESHKVVPPHCLEKSCCLSRKTAAHCPLQTIISVVFLQTAHFPGYYGTSVPEKPIRTFGSSQRQRILP